MPILLFIDIIYILLYILYIYIYIYIYIYTGPLRGSVEPRAKYHFGGPDDVIMSSSGSRVS